eukprot:gene18775-6425_t
MARFQGDASAEAGLLLILGIDGMFSTGSSQAVNYLLFGLSGSELKHHTLGCADEKFEDTVLLIKPDSVH